MTKMNVKNGSIMVASAVKHTGAAVVAILLHIGTVRIQPRIAAGPLGHSAPRWLAVHSTTAKLVGIQRLAGRLASDHVLVCVLQHQLGGTVPVEVALATCRQTLVRVH